MQGLSLQTKVWLEDLVDLVKQMMRYEPSARIRASQALQHPFFRIEDGETNGRGPSAERWSRPRTDEVIVLED